MKDLLMQQGLMRSLLGNEEGQPNDMKDVEWVELEQRYVSTIWLCIRDNVFNYVIDEDSAPRLWAKLEKIYLAKSFSNKLQLRRKLYHLKMKQNGDLMKHMNEFDRIIDQLKKVDMKVEEEEKELLFLASLSDSYEGIKMFDGVMSSLSGVAYVPKMRKNLISLNLLDSKRQALLSFSNFLQRSRVFSVVVLVRSTFRQFVNTSHDENQKKPHMQGISIDVFKATVAVLPYHFTYKLFPFYGSCDQFVEEVACKTFDAAVGGIVITADRSHIVEFSQPYAELRMVMVVKKKDNGLNRVLWFMSPFSREMWLAMAAMAVFTGLAIWFIELRTCNESTDSPSRQVGAVFYFPFAFLFNEHRPRNRLSYLLLVPWLQLTMIGTMAFTARPSSMVTSSQVEPCGLDVDSLTRTNIESVDDYEKALSGGNIKAAFLLTPRAEVFLAKYLQGLYQVGTRLRSGQFWICNLSDTPLVFQRSSRLASDMSEAILNLKQAGELQQLGEDTLSFSDCSNWTSDQTVTTIPGIAPGPFTGLFIFSGGASASVLLITVIRVLKRRMESCIQRLLKGGGLWMWLTTVFFSHYQRRNHQLQISPITSTSQVQPINNS
ncbi:PREDICTED: glutamate receptor 3.2-like [Theobroma cacao]|uniref:Glutamate receptor 3.2-like n=1 Tax=Theobroma cacao TaxID=3641 RepID=A0AB32W1C4_THECC|nr:PREDICTED: glutamate receptor 3.2-like [Theobroma cacao]